MSKNKSQSFIKGAAILAMSGMLVKLIGILYRIPLANILGDQGNGLYGTAYPYYTTMLMLSTAGLPPAISKMVSERSARGDLASANKIFRVALILLFTLGLVSSLALFALSGPLSALSDDALSQMPIAYIAPALFFVCILSAVRGYFQGLGNMKPTAATQIVEQVAKIILGIYFAYKWMPRGIEYGAAGAVLGVTLSELVAMLSIIFIYLARHEKPSKDRISRESSKAILRELLSLAVPILLGASVMPLVTLTDSILIKRLLQNIGFSLEQARGMFGAFSQRVNTLVNVPGTLSLGFCVSMVPAVSGNAQRGDMVSVRRNIETGFKISVLVGVPSAVGLGVLATPIMDLLYGYKFTTEQIVMSGNLLALIAGGVIFLSILQTLNGALQGLGKVYVPVIALGTGALVKIIANLILLQIPSVNIYGAPVSTFLCYLVAASIDMAMVKRFTKLKFNLKANVFGTVAASAIMGGCAWGLYHLFLPYLGSKPSTLIAVIFGILVFAVCIPLFKIMTRREVAGLPGGRALAKFYDALSKKEG